MSLIKDIYKDYENNRLRYSITDKTYLARPKLKQTKRANKLNKIVRKDNRSIPVR